jgi:hypothetical protein
MVLWSKFKLADVRGSAVPLSLGEIYIVHVLVTTIARAWFLIS